MTKEICKNCGYHESWHYVGSSIPCEKFMPQNNSPQKLGALRSEPQQDKKPEVIHFARKEKRKASGSDNQTLAEKRKSITINKSELTIDGAIPKETIVTWHYPEKDVKEKVQNVQKRIKNIETWGLSTKGYKEEVKKIFLEEFGKELIK